MCESFSLFSLCACACAWRGLACSWRPALAASWDGRTARACLCQSLPSFSTPAPREFRDGVVAVWAREFSRVPSVRCFKLYIYFICARGATVGCEFDGLNMKRPASDDRTARILSDRLRTIGVDRHALEEQVVERQKRREREARERHQADEAWSAAWQTVEEHHARRQAAYQERMEAYGAELRAQIESKRCNSGRDQDVVVGGGFMDGFQTSHR